MKKVVKETSATLTSTRDVVETAIDLSKAREGTWEGQTRKRKFPSWISGGSTRSDEPEKDTES